MIKNFRTELHCHLDGSIPVATAKKLINMQKKSLDKNTVVLANDDNALRKALTVPAECASLNDYLECFELPLKLLQTPEAMKLAGYEVAEELNRNRVRYAEIRYAPQLHCQKKLERTRYGHMRLMLQALLDGIEEFAEYASPSLHVKVILCLMRNTSAGKQGTLDNLMTLNLAHEFLEKGVCGVDLAGAEALDATSNFRELFKLAAEHEIPFTIHAGEAGDKEWQINSLKSAIEFGAKRIGHGVGLIHSKELRDLVREKEIVVECCLTSNLQTKAADELSNHPIKLLWDEGIKVTVNTDNMTVSNTTIPNEYELLRKLGFTDADIRKMQMNAVDGAFTSTNEKTRIKKNFGTSKKNRL